MGSLREYFDVAGGVRSGLRDDPPWWAPGAIAAFTLVVVVVLGVSVVLGVGEPPPAGPATGRAPAAAPSGGGGASPSGGPSTSAGADGAPASTAADGTAAGGGTATTAADEGGAGGAAADAGGTVALADRTGTFQQVPRAAVAAARAHGSRTLGIPEDELRHQLISASPGRVEMTISSLDGARELRVAAVEADGAWQAS